ncbi:hypothetical protein B0H14DRAFT_2588948 [Mycena olivaceomarginata]|nr:hypothetical protein B0H14DRAFT_2588948 [Mycena olivaceomarginata]
MYGRQSQDDPRKLQAPELQAKKVASFGVVWVKRVANMQAVHKKSCKHRVACIKKLSAILYVPYFYTEGRSLATYLLEKKITDRLRQESEKKKALSEARYDVEGETLRTKSWTRSAKGYHPKESISEFKDQPDEYGRILATKITLEKCKVRLSEIEFNEMDKELTTGDIGDALKLSNNGRAPGLDGIP